MKIAQELIATGYFLEGEPDFDRALSFLLTRSQSALSDTSRISQDWIFENINDLIPELSNTLLAQSLAIASREFVRGTSDILKSSATDHLGLSSGGSRSHIGDNIQETAIRSGLEGARSAILNSAFLGFRNVEFEYSLRKGGMDKYSVLAVRPIYESDNQRRTLFTQGSFSRQQYNDIATDKDDWRHTGNLGLAYRYITPDEKNMVGANVFFDHQWPYNHNRISIGFDFRTSLYGLSFNNYYALSDWRTRNDGFDERALSGKDIEVSGRLPQAPELELFTKAYHWKQKRTAVFNANENDIYGYQFSAEYTPVNAFTVRAAATKDTAMRNIEGELTFRLNFRLGDNLQNSWRRPTYNLSTVTERRFDKVRRQNDIRVQTRQSLALTGNVLETTGANSLILPNGAREPLIVGQSVAYGGGVLVENSLGAYAELEFGNGGRLRIGTDSEVRLDNGVITLIRGVMQYVSGSTDVTIVVPGGTVILNGTDIDVLSNGASSTLRVRDGGVTANGFSAGTGDIVTLSVGTTTLIPVGDVAYNTHRSEIYSRLDSIDFQLLTIPKAAPYIYRSVRIIQSPDTIGDDLVFAIDFSKPVSLSGAVSLDFQINGLPRNATYLSGNGTQSLSFTYTTIPADANEDEIVIDSLSLNGGSIAGGGLSAIDYVAGTTIPLDTGPIISSEVAVTISTVAGNPTSLNPIPVTFTFDEAVSGFVLGNISVTNGTASNLSTLDDIVFTADITPTIDGIVSISLAAGVASGAGGNLNAASNTLSLTYDGSAPAGYSVAFLTTPINAANVNAASFQVNGAEIGADFTYTISSSGGGGSITDSGTVSAASFDITGIDLSGLPDGTLTVSVVLTDSAGNAGAAVTDTAVKDLVAPTIVSVDPPADGIYDDL
ncbi:MAG: inverse autotransporter beta domain-containing protein [Alphaproteobacteria bacterium]